MDVNHSNKYSPSKRQKRQIISINKANKGDINSNIEKKKTDLYVDIPIFCRNIHNKKKPKKNKLK